MKSTAPGMEVKEECVVCGDLPYYPIRYSDGEIYCDDCRRKMNMKTPITDKEQMDGFVVAIAGVLKAKKVVPSEVARQLEQDLNTCKRALEKIRDFRLVGGTNEASWIAKKALEDI